MARRRNALVGGLFALVLVGLLGWCWHGRRPGLRSSLSRQHAARDSQASRAAPTAQPGVASGRLARRPGRVGPRHPPGHPDRLRLEYPFETGREPAPDAGWDPEPGEEPEVGSDPEEDPPAEEVSDREIHRAIVTGDRAFDAGDFDAAYEHLLWVIDEHPEHRLSPYALYKLAWIEFNLDDVEAAADDMALLLEWIDADEEARLGRLQTAATRDLERFDEALDQDDAPGGSRGR